MSYFTIIEKEETFVLKIDDIVQEFKYTDTTIEKAKKLILKQMHKSCNQTE